MTPRLLEPELLDSLPPDHPAAIHSRRDLQRLNGWMRNASHIWNAIQRLPKPPASILELGAGDGTFLLQVARRFHRQWPHPVRATLLDLEPVVSPETLSDFARLGWEVQIVKANLLEWIQSPPPARADLIIANLFLHHFEDDALRGIFTALNPLARAFIACEPRRWLPSQIVTRFLWLIGCNYVTRNDARISVRAGFRDRELSHLWPPGANTNEYPAGYASHLFAVDRS